MLLTGHPTQHYLMSSMEKAPLVLSEVETKSQSKSLFTFLSRQWTTIKENVGLTIYNHHHKPYKSVMDFLNNWG